MTTGNRRLLAETFTAYAAAIGLIYGSTFVPDPPGMEGTVTGLTVIAVFLVWPFKFLERRKRSLEAYGLKGYDLKRNIMIGAGCTLAILPAFALLYVFAHRLMPGLPLIQGSYLARIGLLKGAYYVLQGLLVQIGFAGITEEVFFRSYMQTNLNRIMGQPWSITGIRFGPALPIVAILFGAVHMLWWSGPGSFNPWGLLVIIPGVAFGFIREWSGSFVAPAIFHGCCNVTIFFLNGTLFPDVLQRTGS